MNWPAALAHLAACGAAGVMLHRLTRRRGPAAVAAVWLLARPLVSGWGWPAPAESAGVLLAALATALHADGLARGGRWTPQLGLAAFAGAASLTPAVLMLPLVWLACDDWPLRRVRGVDEGPRGSHFPAPRTHSRAVLWREQIPALAVALLGGVHHVHAGEARWPSLAAVAAGVAQAAWPVPGGSFAGEVLAARALPAAGLLLAATAGAWLQRRDVPALWTGWCWCLLAVVPAAAWPQHAGAHAWAAVGLGLAAPWAAAAARRGGRPRGW